MTHVFLPGAQKVYETVVTEANLARFPAGEVHAVYSTFALAQDAEWVCRLFVLEMLEAGEEGVGSFVSVQHIAPAVLGSKVRLVATLECVTGNKVSCTYQAFVGERLIAEGRQEQHILNKARFEQQLESLRSGLSGG